MVWQIVRVGVVAALLMAAVGGTADAKDKIRFLTSWRAESEHGGFYQAIVDGTYASYGVDVELQQGGPQINIAQVLLANGTDVALISGSAVVLNMVKMQAPFVAVAAFFQKDPQALLCHREAGYKTLADLKGHPMLVAATGRQTFWKFLKLKYGLSDDQLRPYTFNIAPFLAGKQVCQQGYVTSETFAAKQAGVDPQVFLFANYGYLPYSSILVTSAKLVHDKPELIQHFVDASIKGWYAFLYSPHEKAIDLIRRDNPDYGKDQAEFSAEALIKDGIVDSGDAKTLGIGAMTDARWKSFFDMMVVTGDYPADMNYKAAFTTQFVDKKVGMK